MAPPEYLRLDTETGRPISGVPGGVLVCGRADAALGLLPTCSVRTVVTSPPYWSLRDYEVPDQIGSADALGDYLKSIVTTFDQLRRVLTDDGTVWLNVGDSYT
jgi:DNA modification methylase